jgi:hypothetical protein
MKNLSLAFALTIISISAYSQLQEKIKSEGVVAGSIIKDGKETQGYIKLVGRINDNGKWFSAPWQFQSSIKFITKDVFETTGKITNKLFKGYGPRNIEGYKCDTLVYESVTYADMSAISVSMVPQKMFMRKVKDGRITLFHYFDTPPAVVSGPQGYEPYYIDCAKAQIVYRKDKDGKLKLVSKLNIEKELADCPYVTEKQKKSEYTVVGNEENTSEKKASNNTELKEQVRLMAIADYNMNCK